MVEWALILQMCFPQPVGHCSSFMEYEPTYKTEKLCRKNAARIVAQAFWIGHAEMGIPPKVKFWCIKKPVIDA